MKYLILPFALLLLIYITAASPDEAYGRVVKTVDGDTFDVLLKDHDSRITEDKIRIRLADIDCPEIHGPDACEAGNRAAAYTRSWLLNNYVFLDLDDKTGKDPYGRWVAVCHLSDNGKPGRNYNRMLVDAGHAIVKDFENNEFEPESWWS